MGEEGVGVGGEGVSVGGEKEGGWEVVVVMETKWAR